MPVAPKRQCLRAGCPNLVAAGYCEEHRRHHDEYRGNPCERGYDRRWRKFRAAVLAERPMCESIHGCDQAATEVHHPHRIADGGDMYDVDNTQTLCKHHHSRLRGAGGKG